MPWKETEPMTEKNVCSIRPDGAIHRVGAVRWVWEQSQDGSQVSEALPIWRTRRVTGRSRRPGSSPNATAKSVEALILKERRKHASWGPKKIRDLLIKDHGIEMPPHVSVCS